MAHILFFSYLCVKAAIRSTSGGPLQSLNYFINLTDAFHLYPPGHHQRSHCEQKSPPDFHVNCSCSSKTDRIKVSATLSLSMGTILGTWLI